MSHNESYAGGLRLDFFESSLFEKEIEQDQTQNDEILARNLLRVLMMGWSDQWNDLKSWRTFNAIFVDRDHQMTKAMRMAFQQGFNHIFSQLQGKTLTDLEHNQAQLYISNCLTYLPYADLTPYESFAIPQFVDGQWQLIDYKVEPIELTPTSGFKKLFLHEQDRVFAYGLEPIHHDQAEPHLIFMGTTYPAGQGFVSMVNTDLEAFETAGKKLYRTGHKNITRWLDKQLEKPNPKKTHLCGTSLGGALSLLTVIDQGDKISRVDALNPPGLYEPLFRKSRFDHWDELQEKPEVYVQKQGDDQVSAFGVWKPDWHVLHVTPPADKKGPNSGTDHALNYAGFAETTFTLIDTVKDNEERKSRNFWLYTLLRSLFYYLVLVPFRYLILPPLRFILDHKLALTLTALLTVLFIYFPIIPVAVFGSAILQALLPAAIIGYWLTDLFHLVKDGIYNTMNSYLSQFFAFLEKNPLLGKAIGVAALVATIAIIATCIIFPPLAPMLLLAVAAAPIAFLLFNKILTYMKTLFGYEDVPFIKHMDPALPRNETLDMYESTLEVTLTYKDIHDYYYAKRCVLKGKEFLPDEQQPSEEELFKNTTLTKREVLENSLDEDFKDTKITFTATKAKAHDMHHTLDLIKRIGFFEKDKLKQGKNMCDLKNAIQHFVCIFRIYCALIASSFYTFL